MATGSHLHGYGRWMPEDFKLRRAWLSSLIKKTDTKIPKYLYEDVANPVDQFKDLIEKNSSIYMLANGMFEEVPTKAPYDRDPTTLKKQVRNYKTMLYLFNTLLTKVPEWFGGGDSDIPNGLVGFPYNIIVDWPMGTESGRQFFLDPRVNNCLKDILNAWGTFLKDPTAGGSGPSGGNQALIDAGWTKKEAIEQLENKANEATGTDLSFDKLFIFPDGGNTSNLCVLG
jgi:phosphatidylserine decarboxylase